MQYFHDFHDNLTPTCCSYTPHFRSYFWWKKQKHKNHNRTHLFFNFRRAFVGSGHKLLQRQSDFWKQTRQKQYFFDDTKCSCSSDHCKRSIFWFHENVEKLKYAQNAYQKHIRARPKWCRIAISLSGEHSVPIFEKCAWNTHQIVISRFLHFCAKNDCASGTRLVHVLWFLMIFTKFSLFENWLETLTRTTFPVCTRDCCLRNAAVAADFLQNFDSGVKILQRLSTNPLRNS